MSENFVLIDAYTRKQSIEDGSLIDVTKYAKEKGFKYNVCVTAAAWSCIKDIPEKFSYQDIEGRLWDVLNVLFFRARGSQKSVIEFRVHMPHEKTVVYADRPDSRDVVEEIDLVSVAGPGDKAELVLTVMLPNED